MTKQMTKFDKEAIEETKLRYDTYHRLMMAGCRFFPLQPDSKRPACKWKDENTKQPPDGNCGVAIPDGIVVIDIDTEEALNRVRGIDGWDENTFTIKTPRGFHFYWKTSGKFRFTQFAGNNPILGQNVDLRVGGDGYLVGPFSEIQGRKYRVKTNTKINLLPNDLEDILIKRDVVKIVSNETGGKNFKISQGGRNNTLTRIVGFLYNTHATNENIRTALHNFNKDYCDDPLPDVDIENILKSIGTKRPNKKYNGIFVEPGLSPAETLKSCLDELGIQVRYNLRSWKIEIKWKSDWQPADDLIEAQIENEIHCRCIENPKIVNNNGRIGGMEQIQIRGQNNWNRALNVVAGLNAIDPFEDLYLNKLEPKQDTEFLDNWLSVLLPLEQNKGNIALAKWASRYMFLGIIQRTKEPGCKLDEILTLHGEQGIGKSAVCASIIPPDFREECFTDRLILTSTPREAAESIQGVVLAEASEMTGMSRADIEKVKALITTTQDRVRLAYRKNSETIGRRCIFVGTSNTDCLPNDPTGNRRFVVVKTTGNRANFKIEDWMNDHRNRLFSAALWEYENGQRANLPRELVEYQNQSNSEYRITDDLVEDACIDAIPIFNRINEKGDWTIDESVSVQKLDDGGFGVSLRNVCIVVAYLINQNAPTQMSTHLMQHRTKQALMQTGWSYLRVRVDGKRRRLWQPPIENESTTLDLRPQPPKTEYDPEEIPF